MFNHKFISDTYSSQKGVLKKIWFRFPLIGRKAQINKLIKECESSFSYLREEAAHKLGKIGFLSPDEAKQLCNLLCFENIKYSSFSPKVLTIALPILIKMLGNNWDKQNRISAAQLIAKIRPTPKSAIPRIIKLLDEKDNNLRAATTKVLGQLGPAAKNAIPVLKEQLIDTEYVSKETRETLVKLGFLSSSEEILLTKILNYEIFRYSTLTPKVVDLATTMLVNRLKNNQKGIWRKVLNVLIQLRFISSAEVKLLEKAFILIAKPYRGSINISLDILPKKIINIVIFLIRKLLKENSNYNVEIFENLNRIGLADHVAAVPVLLDFLEPFRKSYDMSQPYYYGFVKKILEILGNLGPAAHTAIPVLTECYKHSQHGYFLKGIASTLADIGPAAQSAVPMIVNSFSYLIKEDMGDELVSIVSHLIKISPEAKTAAIEELFRICYKTACLADPSRHDKYTAYYAVKALMEIYCDTPEAEPKIVPLIINLYSKFKFDEFIDYLGKLGTVSRSCVPMLIKLCYDEEGNLSKIDSAINALGNIGPAGKPAIPVLLKYLDLPIEMETIEEWDQGQCFTSDEDVNEYYRTSAVEALGNIGAAAKVAIPKIIHLRKDALANRYVIRKALQKIRRSYKLSKSRQK